MARNLRILMVPLILLANIVISEPAHADLDIFQNSINEQMNLIDKSLNTCPDDASKEKRVRLQDSLVKGSKTYVLWSSACIDNGSIDSTTIRVSIKTNATWSTYIVANSQYTYLDRNYLGAPFFADLGASGLSIIWVQYPSIGGGGGSKLVGKNFDLSHPENLLSEATYEIAVSTTCGIGTIIPISTGTHTELIYITNNGGTDSCMGDIYSTRFSAGTWSNPELIISMEYESYLSKNQISIDPSNGSIYLCIISRISPTPNENTNLLKVVSNNGGSWHNELLQTYSDVTRNSAISCSLKIDQNSKMHLLYEEGSWTRSSSGSDQSISLNISSIVYKEMILQSNEWDDSSQSLLELNLSLGNGYQTLEYCENCSEKLTLLLTSEESKIQIYEMSDLGVWVKTRDFNDEYTQNVQVIREVWGSSARGYTFLLKDNADELLGKFSWQKGYALDWKPTFSPPTDSHILYSDTSKSSALDLYEAAYGQPVGRFASGEVLKAGNSIIELWEDGGTESTAGATILVEQVIKSNPSCSDDLNFAPGKTNFVTATSAYSSAIINFQASLCGSTPSQAVVEVKEISSGSTREVLLTSISNVSTITGLSPGSSYSFKIKFLNSKGSSVYSKSSNIVTVQNQPISYVPISFPKEEVKDAKSDDLEIQLPSPPEKVVFSLSVNNVLSNLGLKLSKESSILDLKPKTVGLSSGKIGKEIKLITSRSNFLQLKLDIDSIKLSKVVLQAFGKNITLMSRLDANGKTLTLPGIKFPKGKFVILAKLLNGQVKKISILSR